MSAEKGDRGSPLDSERQLEKNVNSDKLSDTSTEKGPTDGGSVALKSWFERRKDDKKVASGKRKGPPGPKPVPFRALFRFITPLETVLNVLGILLAVAAGATTPLMTLMFGNMANALISFAAAKSSGQGVTEARSYLVDTAGKQALALMGIGIGMFVCTYAYMVIWTYTSESQSRRMRETYLQAVLRQEIAYFDDFGPGALASRIQTDTHLVQVSIGEKIPIIVQAFSTLVTGYVVAYCRNARVAGVLTVVLPVQFLIGSTMGRMMPKAMMKALGFVSKAGSVAEEAISSIRTVHAFESRPEMSKRFDELAGKARNAGIKTAFFQGGGVGMSFFMSYIAYSIAWAYGGRLVGEGKADGGTVLNCVMAVLVGTFALGAIPPELQHLLKGRAAAAKLWETIDRVPLIDSSDQSGLRPTTVNGEITLDNVSFRYPSRPDIPVLAGMSVTFEAGKTTALVGPSGGGKSTIIALIERFYNPVAGRVTFDGHDLAALNIGWLRGTIGYVSQEPTLFATTIRENIEMGLIGTEYENASAEVKLGLVREACEAANAQFVERLPSGYETKVGERGSRLSGGQRQRIAIARATVGNPRILLLDEATSALDPHAERLVQDALSRAAKGRTTIVVAHRLSTIRDADQILVISGGKVTERGTHWKLLEQAGIYAELVSHQKLDDTGDGAAEDDERVVLVDDLVVLGEAKAAVAEVKTDRSFGLWAMTRRILSINRDVWPWYLLCFTGAIVNGMAYPVWAILIGLTVADFERPLSEIRGALEEKALFFFIVAIVAGISVACEILGSTWTGWELSRKLRSRAFAAVLLHPISWFDKDENASGAVVARITGGPEKIQGLFGITLGAALKCFTTMIGGIIVGFCYAPLIALVSLATVPLVFSAGYIRLRVVVMAAVPTQALHQESAQMATEAVRSIKTVASLTRENDLGKKYAAMLGGAAARSTKTSLRSNALYASSQAMSFLAIALVFYVGARFVADGRYNTQTFFIGLTAVVMGAVNAGSVFGFVPDASQASAAAHSVFELIDYKIDSDDGAAVTAIEGQLALNSVSFSYPSSGPVLKQLSLDIPAGSFVAIVGQSGCGKSTVFQLLERFYKPDSGTITLDGVDISTLNTASYRSHLAIVSQEPILYSGTIRSNIALGATTAVTDDDIMAAAESANIADFIRSLPDGLDTDLGDHGTQLSGGQRQRVAIARALIRNPRILLLDEATAALDSASERAIQASLEAARSGRTVVAIAHRLSTIQHADIIYVMAGGVVVETGTHQELMAKQGEYFNLAQMQNLA